MSSSFQVISRWQKSSGNHRDDSGTMKYKGRFGAGYNTGRHLRHNLGVHERGGIVYGVGGTHVVPVTANTARVRLATYTEQYCSTKC